MINIQNVSKSFQKGKKQAVDGLTLQINSGEIFGFIGPNGAGKTTTIRMLNGIIRPDAGQIEIDGEDILANPVAAKKKIGYVPDVHEVYDRLTGREYLDFIADIYEIPLEERKDGFEPLLAEYELTGAVDQPIRSYSHGMKQKILLISALIHQPPVWILDEPLTGLDPRSSHELKSRMRKHTGAGNTVFFSTHVLEVAEKLCDRIGIINQGRLIAVGTLEELRSRDRDASLEALFLQLTEG